MHVTSCICFMETKTVQHISLQIGFHIAEDPTLEGFEVVVPLLQELLRQEQTLWRWLLVCKDCHL